LPSRVNGESFEVVTYRPGAIGAGTIHSQENTMLKKILAVLAMLYAAACFAAVDVNKATAAELDSVKGIGPAISSKIVDERKKGPFKDWDDFITRVKGVGDKNAAKLSEGGLTVNGSEFKGTAATKTETKAAAKEEKKAAKEEKKAEAKAAEAKPAAAASASAMKEDKKDAKAEAKAKKEADKKAKAEEKAKKAEEAKAKKEAEKQAKADAKKAKAEAAKPAASAAKSAASAKK
jgi:competence protein ComEA